MTYKKIKHKQPPQKQINRLREKNMDGESQVRWVYDLHTLGVLPLAQVVVLLVEVQAKISQKD